MISIELKDQVTVVIGGTRGIGACCVRLAAEAGSKVAWTGPAFDADMQASSALLKELTDGGYDISSDVVDCTDEQATLRFVDNAVSRWGKIDNLIYCAGFTSPVPFLDLTKDEWTRVVDINLTGAFLAAHSVIPHMKTQGGGRLVLVGSAAIVSGGGGRADYASSKAGLEGLSRAITKEFAQFGIRSNIVHPSLIATDLLKQRHPDPEALRDLAGKVPLRRLGEADDVANLALFLLSDKASYITGQSILVDGGRTYCA